MVNSLRLWLVFSFSAILLICLVAIWLFINAINKSKKLEDYHSHLKTTRILLLEMNKLKEDLFFNTINESGFFTSSFSLPEQRLKELKQQTNDEINYLLNSTISESLLFSKKINDIKNKLNAYTKSTNGLLYLYKLKGFKNYGLEGKMREYAHLIYDFRDKNIRYFCLVLRKHEKDFLLRKDEDYIAQFNAVANQLLKYADTNSGLARREKEHLVNSLYYYTKYFHLLARIERKLGVKGRSGVLNKTKEIFNKIAGSIEMLDNDILRIEDEHKQKLKRDTVIVIILLVLLLAGTIQLITRLITSSVASVSRTFNNYITAGFNFDAVSYKRSKIKEFNAIYVSFLKMAKEIHIFTNFFREKVHERTLAINQQKEEILLQQRKIEEQYQSLLKKNVLLKKQKRLLAIKNSDVQDSLRYAKRIQKAIQPKTSTFRTYFPESFIFSKAKDIVSGDFYLAYRITTKDNTGRIVFVASDCTGHGVPGAIMSVLGINTINKLVSDLKHADPGYILQQLDQDINKMLALGKQQHDIVADGMDISVFSFDPASYQLDYCIAKFSHFLVRDNNMVNLHTQKSSIGYSTFENEKKHFNTNSFQLKPGDCLYLFSDGYIDQFGGPRNKKYKKSNIRGLIENNHFKPMEEQRELFKQAFRQWKGQQEQVDDVTVIGIRF